MAFHIQTFFVFWQMRPNKALLLIADKSPAAMVDRLLWIIMVPLLFHERPQMLQLCIHHFATLASYQPALDFVGKSMFLQQQLIHCPIHHRDTKVKVGHTGRLHRKTIHCIGRRRASALSKKGVSPAVIIFKLYCLLKRTAIVDVG